MRRIELTQYKGAIHYALFDDDDYQKVSAYRWHVRHKNKCPDLFYAARIKQINGKRKTIWMHRFIMNLESNDRRLVDHRNTDGLDNRKCNLRIATIQENVRHSRKHRDALHSQYKGLYWEAERQMWRAYIYVNKKKFWLGRFKKEKDAAIAYNYKAIELFGEYALLNNFEHQSKRVTFLVERGSFSAGSVSQVG
ncbi:MAG: hypothetical protein HZB36_01005 [Candidatus Omnitrophica bacterium]|nr:hypothetical protein [Candidatus Omnitrophota bacterium]